MNLGTSVSLLHPNLKLWNEKLLTLVFDPKQSMGVHVENVRFHHLKSHCMCVHFCKKSASEIQCRRSPQSCFRHAFLSRLTFAAYSLHSPLMADNSFAYNYFGHFLSFLIWESQFLGLKCVHIIVPLRHKSWRKKLLTQRLSLVNLHRQI